MRFRILGCLEIEADGRRLPVSGPSEQKVLAVLLLDANRTVAVSRLVDALWDDPPETAAKQARNAVSRLRKLLATGGVPDVILTDGTGYRLPVTDETLDTRQFESLVAQARADAAGARPGEAAQTLGRALALWRGPALAGLTGQVIEAAATAWNERRCAVMETYYESLLALGRHREVVADLTAQITDHPLREKPVEKLMLALYRCGRRADALTLYGKTRARLAEELGLDPGPELQRLHHQILTGDPALAAPPMAGDRACPARSGGDEGGAGRPGVRDAPAGNGAPPPHARILAVPGQLPAATRLFTGRAGELAALDALLEQASDTVVVSAIGGTAGIGKTALAVHWAHRVASRFPDGQLYVNLRGFDPAGPPLSPARAIGGFLGALGVPAGRVPACLEDQTALYRSLLAGRRVLVLLDNAQDAAQVRPLLPGSAGCLALVTSRAQLTSLVAAEGAQSITLGLLSRDDARDLLDRSAGAGRTAREPAAAGELIDACARLPLALSIAAAQAVARPSLPLSVLAAELRQDPGRLDALDTGDPAASVRAVFSWSYRQLSAPAARIFRLLGLHPGPDFSLASVASLAGTPRDLTRANLTDLARAHLLTEHAPGRYSFHDLLRSFAAEQAQAHEDSAGRDAAVRRVLDHYLYTADAAATLLHPTRAPLGLPGPDPAVRPEAVGDDRQALAWFEAEYRALLAALARADNGFGTYAWQLPWTMEAFFCRRGLWRDWAATGQVALRAAQRLGDRTAQAITHHGLGMALAWIGPSGHYGPDERDGRDGRDGHAHLLRAISLFGESGDKVGEARAELDLGWAIATGGRQADAVHRLRRSHDLYQAADHGSGQALALVALGWCWASSGRPEDALAVSRQALLQHEQLGYRTGEAYAWHVQGMAQRMLGHHREATASYRRSVELCREVGERYHAAVGLIACGDIQQADGDPGGARATWREALAILDDLQHPEAAEVVGKLAGPGG